MSEKSSGQLRAETMEERLTVPVLVSALVSVPAIFLTTTGGTTAVIGTVLNWLSLVVLLGESLILLWVSRDFPMWIRRYRAHLMVVAATVPAVIFAVGPVQIVRLLLSLSAFHVFRAGRIMRAGNIIRSKFGLHGRRGTWLLAGMTVLAAMFVTIVLSDPNSRSREVLSWVVQRYGPYAVFLLVVLLALVITGSVLLRRRKHFDDTPARDDRDHPPRDGGEP